MNVLVGYAGGTCGGQANLRNLQFGIDGGSVPRRVLDCGRLGTSVHVTALAVHGGCLYAATTEFCAHEAGHVYRWAGGRDWIDLGCPDRSNTVHALASCGGILYATTGHSETLYSLGISSPNTNPGGLVYRLDETARPTSRRWVCCGDPGPDRALGTLAALKGKLYATSNRPDEFYRYEGDGQWTTLRGPGQLVMSLGVYRGRLYATANYRQPDRHRLFRYDDSRDQWVGCGKVEEISQVYAQAIYQGKLHIATYPYGKVFRYDGGETLTDIGHLGRDRLDEIPPGIRHWKGEWIGQVFETCVRMPKEQEIQSMVVYNGKLYAGTIPSAEVHRYDGGKTWTCVGCADGTASAYLRRAWSMAIFQGKLFTGSLPAGWVFAFEAGKMVTHDHDLPAGWRHVVAQRTRKRLELHLDGRRVACADLAEADAFDISNSEPLRIGFGQQECFHGRMKDLRIYRHALTEPEIEALRGSTKPGGVS